MAAFAAMGGSIHGRPIHPMGQMPHHLNQNQMHHHQQLMGLGAMHPMSHIQYLPQAGQQSHLTAQQLQHHHHQQQQLHHQMQQKMQQGHLSHQQIQQHHQQQLLQHHHQQQQQGD